jgi:hypothetical protein
MRFTPSDREIIERLTFDPTCEPSFELLRSCLIWPDERPTGISNAGYRLLGDLWIVRGFLHQNVPFEKWGIDPAHFQSVWQAAINDVPGWPGFRRMELSEADRAYLASSLKDASEATDY